MANNVGGNDFHANYCLCSAIFAVFLLFKGALLNKSNFC